MNDELKPQMGKLFSNRYYLFIILNLAFIILLASCSIEKQISKSATEDVLTNKALTSAHVGISIYEPATNKYWYNYQGDHYFVPASNTKLPTCYAAMKYLGDSLVGLRYSGEFKDGVIIQPTGDPTFLYPEFKSQPVYDSLSKVPNQIVFDMVGEPKPFGDGWAWNDYNEYYMAERSGMPIYGNVVRVSGTFKKLKVIPQWFQFKMNKDIDDERVISIDSVTGEMATNFSYPKNWRYSDSIYVSSVRRAYGENYFSVLGKLKPGKVVEIPFYTRELGLLFNLLRDTLKAKEMPFSGIHLWKDTKKIYSQPTDSLLKPMMHRSDNFFAEQTLLMVSNERLGVMSDEKIIDTLL